jgi:hypothetical protein
LLPCKLIIPPAINPINAIQARYSKAPAATYSWSRVQACAAGLPFEARRRTTVPCTLPSHLPTYQTDRHWTAATIAPVPADGTADMKVPADRVCLHARPIFDLKEKLKEFENRFRGNENSWHRMTDRLSCHQAHLRFPISKLIHFHACIQNLPLINRKTSRHWMRLLLLS